MRQLELYFQGSSYGEVFTSAVATSEGGDIVRIEYTDMENLAQLAADVLGDEQPLLLAHYPANLVKWLVRYGALKWGERPFLQAMAKALIWQHDQAFTFEVLCAG